MSVTDAAAGIAAFLDGPANTQHPTPNTRPLSASAIFEIGV